MIKSISVRMIFKRISCMNSFNTYLACIPKLEIAIKEVILAIRLHFLIIKLTIIFLEENLSTNSISFLNKLKKRKIFSSLLNIISGKIC
jgi:hypothetical protein